MDAAPYIPGSSPPRQGPLSRFLPPIPQGVVPRWLAKNVAQGASLTKRSWVLDPFGGSPYLPIEIANQGYRVLVTANNPIVRFLLELAANPPGGDQFIMGLAELASLKHTDERLEPFLRSLYNTQCNFCGTEVSVDSFIWERGNERVPTEPVAKIYHCDNCQQEGEFPVTNQDTTRLIRYMRDNLSQSRLLERVAPPDDPDRIHVEEAMAVYLPRTLYALTTLINKREALSSTSMDIVVIDAILLSAFDMLNTLWAYPLSRSRPKQLFTPGQFKEMNVWLALEEATQLLITTTDQTTRIPITTWPELPPLDGGVCIYGGRLKDIVADLSRLQIDAVVTALPRPNQAFWSLSAIWSGWLWGNSAALPFKSVLRRRRYDWGWHTRALNAVLDDLFSALKPGTAIFGLIGELETGFLNAALVAADIAGYSLRGLSIRPENGQAQIHWGRASVAPVTALSQEKAKPESLMELQEISDYQNSMRREVSSYLEGRGEPADYAYIHAVSLSSIVRQYDKETGSKTGKRSFLRLLLDRYKNLIDLPGQVNNLIERTLTVPFGFIRFEGSQKSIEVGQWWLGDPILAGREIASPLSDRVESAILEKMASQSGLNIYALDQYICEVFPNMYTPSPELIQVCLESYAQRSIGESDGWELRREDEMPSRHSELTRLTALLNSLADRLGFTTQGDYPIVWSNKNGEVCYVWYVMHTALFSQVVFTSAYPLEKTFILLPGSRSNLVAYKLNHDARLNRAAQWGLTFVKFRQIRKLAESPIFYPELFEEQVKIDTLTYNSPQMRLF